MDAAKGRIEGRRRGSQSDSVQAGSRRQGWKRGKEREEREGHPTPATLPRSTLVQS